MGTAGVPGKVGRGSDAARPQSRDDGASQPSRFRAFAVALARLRQRRQNGGVPTRRNGDALRARKFGRLAMRTRFPSISAGSTSFNVSSRQVGPICARSAKAVGPFQVDTSGCVLDRRGELNAFFEKPSDKHLLSLNAVEIG